MDDNPEIVSIYDADQADRAVFDSPVPVRDESALARMAANDKLRLARVRQLLVEGGVRTAQDYYLAAYVFQHGPATEDILVAHQLASVAAFNGHVQARWLSAASLDRFLHRIGREQCLGTQYFPSADRNSWDLAPLDQLALLPDSVRAEFGLRSVEQARDTTSGINSRH